MREQIAEHQYRRASASPEERAARRTNTYHAANSHRAGHYSGLHPEDQPYMSGDVEEDDRFYDTRTRTSARRYDTTTPQVIQQGKRRIIIHNTPPPQRRKREPE